MFSKLFSRKPSSPEPASGIRIYLLQDRLERFPTEKLNAAMQAAWHRSYDPVTFYATSVDDSGAVFKLNQAFYPLIYAERRLGTDELGTREIPSWANHNAFSRFSAEFPGGAPEDSLPGIYWLLGSLVANLVPSSATALYFQEASIFVRITPRVLARMKHPEPYMPSNLVELSNPA